MPISIARPAPMHRRRRRLTFAALIAHIHLTNRRIRLLFQQIIALCIPLILKLFLEHAAAQVVAIRGAALAVLHKALQVHLVARPAVAEQDLHTPLAAIGG